MALTKYDGAVPVGGSGFEKLSDAINLQRVEEHRIGNDLIIRGFVTQKGG